MKSLFLAALCAAPLSALAIAPGCSKQSPLHTIALLELYTSEGCSSCPPADRFVSGLRSSMTPEQVVPLSLHVDYWDYIGWKDAFARSAFSERQRWLSAQAGSRIIYTPEIFVAGHESRGWQRGVQDAVRGINAQRAQADIRIALGRSSQGKLPVEVQAKTGRASTLFVALYENGLQTQVKAGENGGVTLRHDYVVREWLGPVSVPPAGEGVALMRTIALPLNASLKNLGVAAFVQDDHGEVLQALSLPLCE
ncbi:DUF1223 domain-containing protein [Noviherbaspirillum sp.]|jgi:hypothetical protein|uniref:DUF1223 domain-containing protein n=1 Tax=Noviherbaspirillum sp. TaxID=1926288 RepID=UPI0025EC6262|nr:DUF1223 domain-containing protein [Noviherbaspirillum sp.]